MIENIQIGQMYKIVLDKNTWNPTPSFNVMINGTTNLESSSNVSDFNLKDELFTKFGIGLNTYLTISSGELYIAHNITDLATGEISTKPMLVPKLAIDFNASDLIVSTTDISYIIKGINRRFTSTKKMDQFCIEAKNDLFKNLKFLDKFAGELDIEIETKNNYKYNELVKLEEKNREENYKSFEYQQSQIQQSYENAIAKASHTIKEYEKLRDEVLKEKEVVKAESEKNQKFYDDLIILEKANNEYSQTLRKTRDLMQQAADEAGIDVKFPDYNTFIEMAKESLG